MNLRTLALVTTLALTSAATFAQATPSRDINQRKENQQDRIGQGITSGQLTARESSHLEHQESGINREERGMRAQDNGHLTRQDRRTVRAQQNKESRRIYRDKHNTRVARQ